MWKLYEKNNHWVVYNTYTEEEIRVLTRMCAVDVADRLNEFDELKNKLKSREK